jgi:hypothetical protein
MSASQKGFEVVPGLNPQPQANGADGAGVAAAICDHGCKAASACRGLCQPPAQRFSGKRCKWCEMGYRRTGDDHFIVKSIVPAKINVYPCAVIAKAEGRS